jgi:SAM-dependent methyltransferase
MSVSKDIPPVLFDRALYLRRQASASAALAAAFDKRLGGELVERLSVVNRSFDRACLIAARPSPLRHSLLATGRFARIEVLTPPAADDLGLPSCAFDCFISFMDLHCVNDVPGYLAQAAHSLKPDGLALFSFVAGESLQELRSALMAAEQEATGGVTPRVAPMIDLRQAGNLLQRAGLNLAVADLDRLPLRYGNAMTLMQEVKQLGFSNCLLSRKKSLTSPRLLFSAAACYAERQAGPDGRLPATLEIAWAMAWKPHPSQQRPLKPGAAGIRLADALGKKGPGTGGNGKRAVDDAMSAHSRPETRRVQPDM